MAEGYVDEEGRIRWAEEHDTEELALPAEPGDRDPDEDDEDDDEEEDGDSDD